MRCATAANRVTFVVEEHGLRAARPGGDGSGLTALPCYIKHVDGRRRRSQAAGRSGVRRHGAGCVCVCVGGGGGPSRNPTHVSQKTTHTHDGCSQCVRARLCARVCVVWVRLHHTTKSLAPQSNPGMSASSPCPRACAHACMALHLAVAPRGGLVARGQVVVPRVAHHVVQLELVGGEAAARASHARRTVGIRMTLSPLSGYSYSGTVELTLPSQTSA